MLIAHAMPNIFGKYNKSELVLRMYSKANLVFLN